MEKLIYKTSVRLGTEQGILNLLYNDEFVSYHEVFLQYNLVEGLKSMLNYFKGN